MYKVVVMGSCSVGKSTLTIRFIDTHFVTECNPTLEDYYHSLTVVDDEPCQLDIWDTTGTEDFYPVRDQSLLWGDGFLFVYAVNDIDSFNEVNVFWDQVRKIKKKDRVPMVMVANKVDLTDVLVDPTLGKEVANKFGVPFVETSAKTGQGVERAFHELVHEIRRMRDEEMEEPQDCGFKFCTIM